MCPCFLSLLILILFRSVFFWGSDPIILFLVHTCKGQTPAEALHQTAVVLRTKDRRAAHRDETLGSLSYSLTVTLLDLKRSCLVLLPYLELR